MNASQGERRAQERFDLKIPAILKAEGAVKEEEYNLQTTDISADGAFFRTSRALPPGISIKIILHLSLDRLKQFKNPSGSVRIRVNGTVLRNTAAGLAVRFAEDYEMKPVEGEKV